MKKLMAPAAKAANGTGACPTEKKNAKRVDPNAFPEETMRCLAAVKANARKRGLSEQDAEDVAGNAALAVARARDRKRHDASKGVSETSLNYRIINDSVKDGIRASTRFKRTKELLTLDQKVVDLGGVEGEEREIDRVADEGDDGRERTDLKIDVETIVSMLTPLQRKVCGLLMAGVLKRDIPALAGITEHEFKHKVLPTLAKAFAEFRVA